MTTMLALVVGLSIAVAPAKGSTRPPRAPNAGSSGDTLVRVNEATDAGDLLRKVDDHVGAIEEYNTALELAQGIQDPREREQVEPSIVAGLVQAHLGAYLVGKDVQHLVDASAAIERFTSAAREPNPDVDRKFSELRTRVDALRAEADQEAPSRHVESGQAPSTPPQDEPSPLTKKRRLVIAGAVMTGVGGGLLVGSVAALAVNLRTAKLIGDRDEVDDGAELVQPSRGAAFAMPVLTAAALATGVALLIVGKRRPPSDRWVYTPALFGRRAGISVSRRF